MTSFLALTALAALLGCAGAHTCSPGLPSPGRTVPAGDIVVLYGNPLEIVCLVDPSDPLARGGDAGDVVYFAGGDRVERSAVTVLNATAARLYVERPPMGSVVYSCTLARGGQFVGVCLNMVVVGTEPKEVVDFSCESKNLENLTCEWTPPYNAHTTHYNLSFSLGGRSNRGHFFPCPNVTVVGDRHTCVWSISTQPMYRPSYPGFLFRLVGSNRLGVLPQDIRFDHYSHVRMAAPLNLTCVATGPHSAELRWRLHFKLLNFPEPMVRRVLYLSRFDPPEMWHTGPVTRVETNHSGEVVTELLGLPHANAPYDARLFLKPERSVGDSMWSDFSPCLFRTLPELPTRPPDTVAGAFEIHALKGGRKVFVYWRQIAPEEENGDDFVYAVSAEGSDLRPDEVTRSYARFDAFPRDGAALSLRSRNVKGESVRASTLLVPSERDALPEPRSFTKTAYGSMLYELSWKARRDVDNYTLFWCDNARDRPYQCHGRTNWTTVPGDATALNVTVPTDGIYQFAIAANRARSSSGMVWASCTVISDRPVDKMRSVWVNRAGDTFVELNWKLECSDRVGAVTGYNIMYCPIVSAHDTACREPPLNATVPGDANTVRGNATGLRPHTTYKFSVAVVSKSGTGIYSDPMLNNTVEGAPSPPVGVGVFDLRDDRVSVRWSPPVSPNGIIRKYVVRCDPHVPPVFLDRPDPATDFADLTVTVSGLAGYSNYSVTVAACTDPCSPPSSPVLFRTAVGRPGAVASPVPRLNGSRVAGITWDPPAVPGGTVDLYQVLVEEKFRGGRNITHSFNATEPRFVLPFEPCGSSDVDSYSYSVRAVNYDRATDHGAVVYTEGGPVDEPPRSAPAEYYGDWSTGLLSLCSSERDPSPVWILVAGGGFGLFLLGWSVVALYRKYKEMIDIKVKMPAGLETALEKDAHSEKIREAYGRGDAADDADPSPPDAESLLRSKRADREPLSRLDGNERSDCSVNTDSTALSFTSNRGSDGLKDAVDNSDSLSPDSSARLRDVGRFGSRPGSSASAEWTSRPDPGSESPVAMPPYSAVGAPEWNFRDPPPEPQKDYVSLNSLVKTARGPQGSPLLGVPSSEGGVTRLPSGYVLNGIAGGLPPAPVSVPAPAPDRGYVRVEDPRTARPGLSPSVVPRDALPTSPCLSDFDGLSDDGSDYVKRTEPLIRPDPAVSHAHKNPRTSIPLSLIMPAENVAPPGGVVSPEAYCRIGPNTAVHQLEYGQNADDGDSDLSSIKDEHSMLYFEEPPRDDVPVPTSHYVQFKH